MENFIKKAASLKANFDAAKAALFDAQETFDDAKDAYNALFEEAAEILRKDFYAVQKTLGEKKIAVYKQFGGQTEIGSDTDIYIDGFEGWFAFTHEVNRMLARYDTPEQVKTVIELFAAAIARGDTEFKFPSVDELKRTE